SLEEASRLEPKDARVWLALAQTHQKSGHAQLAEQAAGRAQQLAPDDPLILHGLAIYYSQAGQPKATIEVAKKALASENSASLHNLLGKAYDQDGQAAQAVRELQQAVELA